MLVNFQIKIFAIYFYIRDAVKVTSYIFHVLMFLDSVFFPIFWLSEIFVVWDVREQVLVKQTANKVRKSLAFLENGNHKTNSNLVLCLVRKDWKSVNIPADSKYHLYLALWISSTKVQWFSYLCTNVPQAYGTLSNWSTVFFSYDINL